MLRRQALLAGLRAEVDQGALDAHLDNVERFADDGVRPPRARSRRSTGSAARLRGSRLDAGRTTCARHAPSAWRRARPRPRVPRPAASGRSTSRCRTGRALRGRTPAASRAVDAAVAQLREAAQRRGRRAPRRPRTATSESALPPSATTPRHRRPLRPALRRALHRRRLERAGPPPRARHARASVGQVPKALVLDCDNTLWGGILGEDGLDGIALDPTRYPGNVFWTVQQTLAGAAGRRACCCACASKNNPEDVAEALEAPSRDGAARASTSSCRRSAGTDKIDSLIAIADELEHRPRQPRLRRRLGLRDRTPSASRAADGHHLPGPRRAVAVARRWRHEIAELFTTARSGADTGKTEQYRARAAAHAEERATPAARSTCARSTSRSTVRVRRARSRRRASPSSRRSRTSSTSRPAATARARSRPRWTTRDAAVLSLHVRDRFGEHGLTGVRRRTVRRREVAEVEAFLMSCRVLGRGIELCLLDRRSPDWPASPGLHRRSRAAYLPTAKERPGGRLLRPTRPAAVAADHADAPPLRRPAVPHCPVRTRPSESPCPLTHEQQPARGPRLRPGARRRRRSPTTRAPTRVDAWDSLAHLNLILASRRSSTSRSPTRRPPN